MNDDEQQFKFDWLIDLAIAAGLLLCCVWGAAFIAGLIWGWVR